MLTYDFMLRAFAASGIVALVAGTVGYFLVLRGQTFAGHALSHVGFAGATGGALAGIAPLWGVLAVTLAAGLAMGLIGERLSGRDVATGIVLALALAFGLLFLSLNTSTTLQATTVLFGNVLAVSPSMLVALALLGVATLAALAVVARPLLFASLQPELAEAKGVSLRLVATLFMAIVALAVAQSVQIVGILLVFTLMVGPPAAAQLLVGRLVPGILLSAALAVAQAWLGIAVAYHTDWPTSFCITILSAVVYFAALILRGRE
ncbi:MAG: metal ABC transporter permease [Bauldia sp.]|nr:MAG: metal ABC transporter permease [Bauldia sp.]MBZ0227910.1 metal ABC transporter permease [Bauldia sp.]